MQKLLYLLRDIPEAVDQLFHHIIHIFFCLDGSDPFVDIQFLVFILNIGFRDVGIDVQVHGRVEALFHFSALELCHRFIEHLAVEVIPHCLHVPALRFSQQVARAADLQVPHGDLDAGSQVRKFPDRGKALLRHFF